MNDKIERMLNDLRTIMPEDSVASLRKAVESGNESDDLKLSFLGFAAHSHLRERLRSQTNAKGTEPLAPPWYFDPSDPRYPRRYLP